MDVIPVERGGGLPVTEAHQRREGEPEFRTKSDTCILLSTKHGIQGGGIHQLNVKGDAYGPHIQIG